MARQVRIEYPGAVYHAMARGDRREEIFRGEEDRALFLRTVGQACERCGWRVHAFALMSNHYHLVLETPEANLVNGMRWLQNTYTKRFNLRHALWGHVFGDRYKAVIVEAKEANYFGTLLDYVHLNPVRAGVIGNADELMKNSWTSLRFYTCAPGRRPIWMEVATGMATFGFKDRAPDRRRFFLGLEQRIHWEKRERAGVREIEGESLQSTLRRGWYFGSQAFREALLERAAGTLATGARRKEHGYRGWQMRDHGTKAAEAIVQRGLRILGVRESDLAGMAKGDWRKILIAECVRARTVASLGWIKGRLQTGDQSYTSRLVGQMRKRLDKERNLVRLREAFADEPKAADSLDNTTP